MTVRQAASDLAGNGSDAAASKSMIVPKYPLVAVLAGVMAVKFCIAGPAGRLDEQKACRGEPSPLNHVDRWHELISYTLSDSVERLDKFFGEAPIYDENRVTRLQTSLGVRQDRHDGTKFLTDLKLRLALPRMENRLQILVDESARDDQPREFDSLSGALRPQKPDAGLRYIFKRDEKRSVGADLGGRISSSRPQIYARLRGRVTVPLDPWEARLTQSVAWFSKDRWRETSQVVWSRKLRNDCLFRSESALTWEERKYGVTPFQEFSFWRTVSPRTAFRLAMSGIWPETPCVSEANYSTVFTWRQLAYRDWLFLEVAPGVEFPQKEDYEINPLVTVKLEVVFSGKK